MTLLTLEQAAGRPAGEVGGKARGLGRLVAIGLPVPDARVLPAAAHAGWLEAGRLGDDVRAALAAVAGELGAPLAVRSSAADEDAADKSAAGQYDSVMGVDGAAALEAAIERCYRAADSERVRAYGGGGAVALVVQREVAAGRAGVAFSADPVSGARDVAVVEAVFGHGEGIVSGLVTPDRYVVGDGGVRARRAAKAAMADGRGAMTPLAPERRLARVLRDDEVLRVADLVDAAQRAFGVPVDVEFCFEGERLWLVQCRPVTTLDVAA